MGARETIMKRGKRTILLTGGTGFIGRRLVKKLLVDKKVVLYLLVRRASWSKAEKMLEKLQGEFPDIMQRVQLVSGDISRPLLLDDKAECLELQKKVQEIFHLAANYQLGISKQAAMQANVDGTLHMLDFARGCQKLRRVNYVSTLAVAGDYRGKWHEDMLLAGQQFDNYYAYTKFLAEVEVRAAMDDLPIAIYRPGIVVGDSISGEMDKVDGPYYLLLPFLRLQKLTTQISPLIPIIFPLAPGGTRIKCHVVPVDYVVNCLDYISRQKDIDGKTFSLTDPKPLSVRQFLETFCERAGWIKPLADVDTQLLVWMLRLPGIKELSHSLEAVINIPIEMVHYTAYATEYDTANVRQTLEGSGISCPPLRSYAGKLLAFARQHFV
jgi:thioester reductase-like protein